MQPISVTELNQLINTVLTTGYDFPRVLIEGEVSGYKVSQDKWVYFDLKDGKTIINCFMTVWQLKTPIEDGMKVVISGKPKLRDRGYFSYTVDTLVPHGEGALRRAYEMLKARLESEGLFALERKRPIPKFPREVGLITAKESAAYHDFVNTMSKRFGGVSIQFAPVLVQGKNAIEEITNAIKWFSHTRPHLDALVIIRGGGSLEDLIAFNSEEVARAVYASKIPVVSGVGHDVDVSLCDLVADLRAKTPTDAAVLVAPDRRAVAHEVHYFASKIQSSFERHQRQHSLFLDNAVSFLIHFSDMQKKRYYEFLGRLEKDFGYFIRAYQDKKLGIVKSRHALISRFALYLDVIKNKVEYESRTLDNLDPKKLLARGYSIVFKDGKVVKGSGDVRKGEAINIRLHGGSIDAERI